jgi:hypothetical protein
MGLPAAGADQPYSATKSRIARILPARFIIFHLRQILNYKPKNL